jgi:hypothetical protein
VAWTYGALLLSGCAQILNRPARDALMPTLVPPAQLARAIALASSLHQVASMAAPALAGLGLALFHSALPIHAANTVFILVALLGDPGHPPALPRATRRRPVAAAACARCWPASPTSAAPGCSSR